ncbi:NAD(P)-binding protein [Laetiporus sulphureus 93-53]|uniref:NAD(P)-binding protein n=1 Tax=Laetiporus sulphureus 93-53 TaxID=1314785 RepID=A0A165HPI7_9APHY|nr:NAD(P)-binding protein [Laetiporus sulphureus 93-53]KZT12010.1 NAD(P)-binding protein [Laetiporus sulphureus 93-53]
MAVDHRRDEGACGGDSALEMQGIPDEASVSYFVRNFTAPSNYNLCRKERILGDGVCALQASPRGEGDCLAAPEVLWQLPDACESSSQCGTRSPLLKQPSKALFWFPKTRPFDAPPSHRATQQTEPIHRVSISEAVLLVAQSCAWDLTAYNVPTFRTASVIATDIAVVTVTCDQLRPVATTRLLLLNFPSEAPAEMANSLTTVLITGCSQGGIGDALARRFHEQGGPVGYEVFATARDSSKMEHLTEMGIKTLQLDVTDLDAVRRVKSHIAEVTGGKLHILVNNAHDGSAHESQPSGQAATDLDVKEVRDLFEVNVFAVMTMVQEFIHMLIASGDARIVQIGSIVGICPLPFSGANTLRVELAPFGVKVITVITGNVKSNIAKPRSLPSDSLYKPIEAQYQARRVNPQGLQFDAVGAHQSGSDGCLILQVSEMDTDQYARKVVQGVISQNPRAWFWAGNPTWLVWFMDTFLGRRAFVGNSHDIPKSRFLTRSQDSLMTRMYGLDEVAAAIAKENLKDV